MRFKEFLLREEEMLFTLEEGLSNIKKHCHQYLHDVQGAEHWLYRGMKLATNKVIAMDHISERYPRDSAPYFNVFFNAGCDLAFGIPMVRSTSLFCTGDINWSKEYGNTYFVFPQGKYEYIWSPAIADSYIFEDRFYEAFSKMLAEISNEPAAMPHQIKNALKDIYNSSGANIRRAVTNMKTNDEMIEGSFDDNDIHVSIEEIDQALKNTFSTLYKQESIKRAIDVGNEILIHDSDGAYFVPRALVQSEIDSNKELEGQSPEEWLSNYFWGA